jgi:hypothetical protein
MLSRQEGNPVYYSISGLKVFELCDVVCSSLAERIAAPASVFSTGTAHAVHG